MSWYTLAVTSCDRHDLLRITLESFLDTVDQEPRHVIVVEDGPTPAPDWFKAQFRRFNPVWLTNDRRMGQTYSLDRLYAEIKTEHVFHLEDDWQFVEAYGYIRKSFDILKYPEIWTVSLRGDCGWHPLIQDPEHPELRIAQPYWHDCWGGLAFNPGLRRLSDYKRIGSYGKQIGYGTPGLEAEKKLSRMHLDMGYRIADLGKKIIVHTGGSRSRAIEPLPPPPRLLIAIPACFALEYGKWESSESPRYDPATAYNGQPYGTDIHISGQNPRIQAVRDTWFRDVRPFAHHVMAKFFYGRPPGGYPRPPLEDEVFLDCPDDYAGLPQKTMAILRWARENDFELVYKADDDTAVYVDRLLQEVFVHRFEYAGYVNGNVCTGGPGYFVGRRAMNVLLQNPQGGDHWAEDVSVGKILSYNSITPLMLGGHRPGYTQHWFFGDQFDPGRLADDIVTMHAVQPDVMRQWYAHKEKQ